MGCYRSSFSAVFLPRQSLCARLISIPAFFKLAVTPHKKEKCKLTKEKTFKMQNILSDQLNLCLARYDLQDFLEDSFSSFFFFQYVYPDVHSLCPTQTSFFICGKKTFCALPRCGVYCAARNVHSKVQACSCRRVIVRALQFGSQQLKCVSYIQNKISIGKTSCSEHPIKWEAMPGEVQHMGGSVHFILVNIWHLHFFLWTLFIYKALLWSALLQDNHWVIAVIIIMHRVIGLWWVL